MKYKRIKFEMMGFEKDFYRDFLIREDVNLLELGIIFIVSVYGNLEHLFCIRDNNRTYVTEQEDIYSPNMLYMSDHSLSDLDNEFMFVYDYGENWTFKCSIDNKSISKPGNEFVYLLDGRGLGIFEDNRYLFMKYMNSGINDEEVDGIWNLHIMSASEIDYYDVECEDYRIRNDVPYSIYEYIEDCQEEGFEIDNIDLSDYKSDEELDEYFDDEKEIGDLDMVQMAFLESANYFIENTKFGKEEYERLLKNHEDFEIIELFMMKLLSLVTDDLSGRSDDFNKRLIKGLREEK